LIGGRWGHGSLPQLCLGGGKDGCGFVLSLTEVFHFYVHIVCLFVFVSLFFLFFSCVVQAWVRTDDWGTTATRTSTDLAK
jgi:hypothetical protein